MNRDLLWLLLLGAALLLGMALTLWLGGGSRHGYGGLSPGSDRPPLLRAGP